MDIDWNKAPEGATHFSEGNPRNGTYPAWWRPISKREGLFECWAIGTSFGCEIWQPGPFHLPEKAVKRKWAGEGLPPVGTVCEWKEKTGFSWVKATVLLITEKSVVMQREDGFEWQMITARTVFRPIKSPEQIAAEKYEEDAAALAEILSGLDGANKTLIAKTLLDCGYSKQVTK